MLRHVLVYRVVIEGKVFLVHLSRICELALSLLQLLRVPEHQFDGVLLDLLVDQHVCTLRIFPHPHSPNIIIIHVVVASLASETILLHHFHLEFLNLRVVELQP